MLIHKKSTNSSELIAMFFIYAKLLNYSKHSQLKNLKQKKKYSLFFI